MASFKRRSEFGFLCDFFLETSERFRSLFPDEIIDIKNW